MSVFKSARERNLWMKAIKMCEKMAKIEKQDKVSFYYYRTTCQGHNKFRSNYSSTEKEYYFEFFDYLEHSEDAEWAQVWFRVDGSQEQATIDQLINICILFQYPYDKKLLTEAWNERQPKKECDDK